MQFNAIRKWSSLRVELGNLLIWRAKSLARTSWEIFPSNFFFADPSRCNWSPIEAPLPPSTSLKLLSTIFYTMLERFSPNDRQQNFEFRCWCSTHAISYRVLGSGYATTCLYLNQPPFNGAHSGVFWAALLTQHGASIYCFQIFLYLMGPICLCDHLSVMGPIQACFRSHCWRNTVHLLLFSNIYF